MMELLVKILFCFALFSFSIGMLVYAWDVWKGWQEDDE